MIYYSNLISTKCEWKYIDRNISRGMREKLDIKNSKNKNKIKKNFWQMKIWYITLTRSEPNVNENMIYYSNLSSTKSGWKYAYRNVFRGMREVGYQKY